MRDKPVSQAQLDYIISLKAELDIEVEESELDDMTVQEASALIQELKQIKAEMGAGE